MSHEDETVDDSEGGSEVCNPSGGVSDGQVMAERASESKKRKSSEPLDVPSTSGTETNNQLPPWVAGGSPARFISSDDLLKMSLAMDNLALVHEIAIDPNFSVSEIPKNPIEAAVKENMYRAYWDILTEDLQKDPPDYTHAFNLLMEIKQTILEDILSPAHVRLRAEVDSVLDENTLRNKLEQNCLDVQGIGRFIVGLLGRLCAPERDTLVEKLRHEEGIVELIKYCDGLNGSCYFRQPQGTISHVFRGIFGLIDIMKNDLTNYTISQNRDAVEEYSAQFEYKEFLKFLDKFPDGSIQTKEWLKMAYHEAFPSTSLTNSEPEAKREKVEERTPSDQEVIKSTSKGYLRLVQSQSPSPFPETMRIDKVRLCALAEKFLQMNIVTSAVFVACNLAGKQVSESEGFKRLLKDQLIIITNDIEEKNLAATVEAVCEQCISTVKKCASDLGVQIQDDQEKMLREQIKAIADERNAIRALVCSRISTFVDEMLCSPSEVPRRLLPGLSVIQSEICAFTARLLRICIHNRRTFFELYRNMLKEIMATAVLDVRPSPPKCGSDYPSYPDHLPTHTIRQPLLMHYAHCVKFLSAFFLQEIFRYTALGLGILWGAYRLRQIREYHADIREWEHEKAVAKAEEEAKKKKWLAKDEMRYLMKVVDLPFEEGVSQFGVADLYRED
ncbi:T-complex protein 11 [Ancylostoma caninum]|uniref:T-complex protein 11 n=1 Tax=Ancylostoma caninum TaxID=29170 RepID=A0A368GRI0_ANCCA|nr:T-complex protein 11 [Ancylostoma caninum]